MSKLGEDFASSDVAERDAPSKPAEGTIPAAPRRARKAASIARPRAAPERKWSRRKMLAFVFLTCGGFWLAAALLFHLLA
jgi:hypothetical protein